MAEDREGEPLLEKKKSRCCSVTSSIRRYKRTDKCLTSPAGLLALLWTVTVIATAQVFMNAVNYAHVPAKLQPVDIGAYLIFLSLYIIAGYIADIKVGRYLMVTGSLYALLVLTAVEYLVLAFSMPVVLFNLGENQLVTIAFSIPVSMVRLIFIANIVQYGVDQLHDSPGDHQSLFIHWFVWATSFGECIAFSVSSFGFFQSRSDTSFVYIGSSVYLLLSVASVVILVVSLLAAKYRMKWFLVDSNRAGQVNPYKLIFKVTKFAFKHKSPVQRSAFTYCEDDLPTGLDLGKSKYGGPFTTEEVEDSKAFFGILKVLIALGPYYAVCSGLSSGSLEQLNYTMLAEPPQEVIQHILLNNALLYELVPFVCIPLYLFLIRPFTINYTLKMLRRIELSIVLTIISIVINLITVIFSSSNTEGILFRDVGTLPDTSAQFILTFLFTISETAVRIASYEFICSQSPSCMKGFLIGINLTIPEIFRILLDSPLFLSYVNIPGAGLVVYISGVIVGTIVLIAIVYIDRHYKYRKRDDLCHVQFYVEEYYSNLIQRRNQWNNDAP